MIRSEVPAGMERSLRWGSLASLTGKRETQGGLGHPPLGRVGPLCESPMAPSLTPPTAHSRWPGEALGNGGKGSPLHPESTEAFLSDSEHII